MAERAGAVRTYSDLLVYKQAYRLALDVSRLTKEFPRQEQFEIGPADSQLQPVGGREYRGGLGQTKFSGGIQTPSDHCHRRVCRNKVLD